MLHVLRLGQSESYNRTDKENYENQIWKCFMLPADVINISKTLGMMAELEMTISEFYKCAGDLWKEDCEFWADLAQAEASHAEYIRKMADILNKKPQEFEPGRPLNTAAINTAISGVRNYIQRLRNGEFNKKQTLFISRDTEQSILESKYTEILKTKEAEYQKLISEVASQTAIHKTLLLKKIDEVVDSGL